MPFGALVGIEITAFRGRHTKALESPQSPDDHGSGHRLTDKSRHE